MALAAQKCLRIHLSAPFVVSLILRFLQLGPYASRPGFSSRLFCQSGGCFGNYLALLFPSFNIYPFFEYFSKYLFGKNHVLTFAKLVRLELYPKRIICGDFFGHFSELTVHLVFILPLNFLLLLRFSNNLFKFSFRPFWFGFFCPLLLLFLGYFSFSLYQILDNISSFG